MDYSGNGIFQARILNPSPGDLTNPGIKPRSPPFQVGSLPAEPPGKPKNTGVGSSSLLQQIFQTKESNHGLLHCRWILYSWATWDCADHNKPWKSLQEMGISDYLTWLLGNLYASQEETVRTGHGTGSKLGKKYANAVYCHLAYLTYMQSTSWKMPDWMKHKLESNLHGEISITSDIQMTPPLWQKVKRN